MEWVEAQCDGYYNGKPIARGEVVAVNDGCVDYRWMKVVPEPDKETVDDGN